MFLALPDISTDLPGQVALDTGQAAKLNVNILRHGPINVVVHHSGSKSVQSRDVSKLVQ